MKPQVILSSAQLGGKTIPPPHPRLIGLHAACSRIAHMSGAGENLVELFRETEQISSMTKPNAANKLIRALKKVQLVSRARGSMD